MSNTILDNPTWLAYGDRFFGDNDPIYGAQGSANSNARSLLTYIQAIGGGANKVIVQWVSASSIKVLAGSVCWADDGAQGYAIDTDITITLSGLSNNSAYFVFVGENGGAVDADVGNAFDDATDPSGFTHTFLVPGWFLTDGSGNAIQFANSLNPTPRTGEALIWTGTYLPYGTVLANGAAYTRTGAPFSRGFALFGTTFGVGDGSTTYNIPSASGRAIVGVGSGAGLTTRALGASFGAETHQLVSGELAAHTHTGPSHQHSTPAHTHTIPQATLSRNSAGADGSLLLKASTLTATSDFSLATDGAGTSGAAGTGATGSTGSDTAHNNVQPSLALNVVLAL